MKRILLLISLLLCTSFSLLAQSPSDGIIKFLGIPIDGTVSQMAAKIKAKGFTYNTKEDYYSGQFNGKNVTLRIVANRDKVYRICVFYPEMSESTVIMEYNVLWNQFKRNPKYLDVDYSEEIPQREDISYEMSINNKIYGAAFSYVCPDIFSEEDIMRLKEKIIPVMRVSTEEEVVAAFQSLSPEDQEFFMEKMPYLTMGQVWFKITEAYGDYQIVIYYDNQLNMSNGEDL